MVKFNEGDILVVEDLGKDDPAPGTRSGLAKSSTAKDLQNLQVLNSIISILWAQNCDN